MPHTPYPREVIYIGPPLPNRLGKAGFWTSLLGLFTCGLLSPIGLLMSFLALSRKPRGAAISGLVIGLIGTLWIGFVVTLVGAQAMNAAAVEETARKELTRAAMTEAEAVIEQHRADVGRLPEGIAGNKMVLQYVDAWKGALRYDLYDDGDYVIRSAGPDQKFDNGDDLVRRHDR